MSTKEQAPAPFAREASAPEQTPTSELIAQLVSLLCSLDRDDQVSQVEIKAAVQLAIQLHQDFPNFKSVVMLAFRLGNYHYRRAGTESELNITTDKDFADNLRQLQTTAVQKLQAELEHIPQTDDDGNPRDNMDVEFDILTTKQEIRVVTVYLGQLIDQASPKQE